MTGVPPRRRRSRTPSWRRTEADRAAVIDIGSNTIHLLVADRPGGLVRPLLDEHVHAGLGLAVAEGTPLGAARIQAVADVVRAYAAAAQARGAQNITVIGTHAVRAAPDRAALIDAIEREAGATVSVLSTQQEAVLCVAGASLGPLPPPPFLCVDMGGGSCDLAAVGPSGVTSTASIALGSGVLAARDLVGDPPPSSQVRRTGAAIRDRLAAVDSLDRSEFAEIVATGGAARRLRSQFVLEPNAVALTVDALEEMVGRLLGVPSVRWPRPVRPGRAALTRAGGIILRAITARWQASVWRVSPYGLREGALARRVGEVTMNAAASPRRTEDTGGHPNA